MGKKYFRAAAVLMLLLGIFGWKTATDAEFRMHMARRIAGEGMIRLVAVQCEKQISVENSARVQENFVDPPRAALTFDDGPHRKYTPMLLKGLRERGVHATFFLMGKNIEGNEEIVKQMKKDGHLIGNHTYDHVQLNRLPGDMACQQILKTNNKIYEVTGEYPMYLRPPYGDWPKNLELCVSMIPVFWDVDTLDWQSKNVEAVEQIAKREVKDGSIILMHDCFRTSVEAALQVADMLKSEGYDLVTADELLVS